MGGGRFPDKQNISSVKQTKIKYDEQWDQTVAPHSSRLDRAQKNDNACGCKHPYCLMLDIWVH